MVRPRAQRGSPEAVRQLQRWPLRLTCGADFFWTFGAAVWVREGRGGVAGVEARRGAAPAVHLRGMAGIEVVGRGVTFSWSEYICRRRASGEDTKRR